MAASAPGVKAVFDRAFDLESSAEREAYLAVACADHPEVRQKVEALLRAYSDAGSFLDAGPVANPEVGTSAYGAVPADLPTAAFSPSSAIPTADHGSNYEYVGAIIAGKYTLVEPIGEGGMGSVWRAKQTEPVKRYVAVKLIKAGMDSKQVLARFEAERQALALMDHPNIAKVLDGGLYSSPAVAIASPAVATAGLLGRPYFVMELVKGTPITEYCDVNRLTPQKRLELFVQVCQAIQHAHQKGVIHRDIKPNNVLVAMYDDKPVVKVIDFGVAKATGSALTEYTIDTGFGGVVGTPQYMSPEQATFNNLDIDTRSDVYALGVLLYELLAGSTPFSNAELKKKGLLEMLRVVREEEPPRPSAKLSTADALPSLSANRSTEPKKLTGLLRNDLDWIVMKALEKDRTRRYETANGFAADVLRYLSGEAVQAHPPTAGYRFKKFVHRNKGQVIAAGLIVLALATGIAGTTWQAAERRREREVNQLQSRQVITSALDRAEAALLANRLTDVDSALLLVTDPCELSDRLASIRADREMVGTLEDIYEKYWTVCPYHTTRDAEPAKAKYPEVFRKFGVDVSEMPIEFAAKRVQQSRIAQLLIDGLNTWFFLDPKYHGLQLLLDRLDPNEFRVAVRAAVATENRDRLDELAVKADASQHPPTFGVMLASAVSGAESNRILKATWSQYPDSFAAALALTFPGNEGNQPGERLGWCRTAVALRPNNALAHYYLSLGICESDRKDKLGRYEPLCRAVALAPRFTLAHAEMGHALFALERDEEALAAFHRATEIDPTSQSGLMGAIMVHLRAKDWITAANAWRNMLKLTLSDDDEGCASTFASFTFWAFAKTFHGRKLAEGLLQLKRYNELANLFVELRGDDFCGEDWNDPNNYDSRFDMRRFLPACAAVQAAAGRGVDAPPPNDRSRIRQLALEWLTADLDTCRVKLASDSYNLWEPAHITMTRWLTEPLLDDVRGSHIRELPMDEQAAWIQLWKEVTQLRDETAIPKPPREIAPLPRPV